MKCYCFDLNGYYTETAESTTLENGSTLLPPNSVTTAPPKQEKGCRLKWIGEWVNEEIIPEPIPEPVPIEEPTLEELKKAKEREIVNARYEAEIAGINWKEYKVATDRDSRSAMTSAYWLMSDTETRNWKLQNLKGSRLLFPFQRQTFMK